MQKLTLTLKTGQSFTGESFGYYAQTDGETVFNTGVTGYEQTLTDPSYRGQILVLTHPLVGNYGVPDETEKDEFEILKFFESSAIHIRALIVSEYSDNYSHWRAKESLSSWLKRHKIPAISGIDTRALTQILRDQGSTIGSIQTESENTPPDFNNIIDPNTLNLVDQVSVKTPITYTPQNTSKHIVLIDCGIKNNIIRHFLKRGVQCTVVPWDYDVSQLSFDGLFISNGPGDPKMISPRVSISVQYALEKNIPVFGICLGNQLTALAIGADTYKMPYGHRGINQPCIHLPSKRCYITSQNHGFAVDEKTLPDNWELLWINGNDGTSEGMRSKTKKAFTVQFHPEACPGPEDTEFLFDEFLSML